MGSPFTVTCYARSAAVANRAFDAVDRRVRGLTMTLSDYHDRSELNRLCDGYRPGEPHPASPDLLAVLTRSRQISEASGGAFDPTVGPLVKLWRRARRARELPDPAALAAARAAVGWEAVTVDEEAGTVTIARPGVRLDLGGIAKGYAADEALRTLREHGVTRALIDAGGDVVAGDPPPGEDGWTVGLADPANPDAPPTAFLALANAAVATSGDAYKFVEIDGVRYSHLVDPRTGLGLTDRSTVTVLAGNGITADALASAVSVLGPGAGVALLERFPNVEGRVATAEGVRETSGWMRSKPGDRNPRALIEDQITSDDPAPRPSEPR